MHRVRIQVEDFDIAQNQNWLLKQCDKSPGAAVSFVGLVRDYTKEGINVSAIELQHYAGMTEILIERIIEQAKRQWQIDSVLVIHRIGVLNASQQIVYVGVTSEHRGDAFKACEYIMDYLKTDATLWKKEFYSSGSSQWLDCKQSDKDAVNKWD